MKSNKYFWNLFYFVDQKNENLFYLQVFILLIKRMNNALLL